VTRPAKQFGHIYFTNPFAIGLRLAFFLDTMITKSARMRWKLKGRNRMSDHRLFANGATLAAAALTATVLGVKAAAAIPVEVFCPGTVSPTDREFSITTDPGTATCLSYGPGNIAGGDSDFAGYTFIDKFESPDDNGGALDDALTVTGLDGTSGTFSFTAPGYTSFIVALKSGEGQLNPHWAAFLLPAGVTSGSWTISSQGLSHVNLYGIAAEIPVPAALPLFASALVGGGLLSWRRRRKSP